MPERYLGQTLGKYRVEELVGSGGFAWVYRGFDPELEIPVALKVLKPQFAGDSTFEQRFRREASTAAKLRHPNIVKIFAVGRDGDAVYFAMDYLPNGLADRLEVVNCLPEEFVARVGMDVASALGFAHREGVIHRDIKVDNILFDAHGNAVVADFGIARAVSGYTGQTGTNMVVGTPQYFAPEQARAKPLDGRADIYSLGVTLFRAATGRLPFEGDDWYEIARQHVEEPPPSPRQLNPALSEEFESILLSCLAKHPDDRPPTGEALCQQFAVLLHGSVEHSTIRTRLVSTEPTMVVPQGVALVPSAGGAAAAAAADTAEVIVEPERPWMRRALTAGVGVLAMTLLVAAWLAGRDEVPAAPTPVPDSAVAQVAPPPPESLPPLTAADSARRDSVAQGAPPPLVPPPAPRTARLIVHAAGAAIAVDGAFVGDDRWSADSIAPGRHTITATLPSAPEGCETASQTLRRNIAAGQSATVTLSPRNCGLLNFNVRPTDVEYTTRFRLTPGDEGGAPRDGLIPLSKALVLPEGRYKVVISRRYCREYEDEQLIISAGRPTDYLVTLDCSPPPKT